jgi:hypothetical protein
VRPVALALLLLALAPPGAGASPRLTLRLARPEVRFGQAHVASGALADELAAVAGRTVVLEGKRAPFTGAYHRLARTVTDAHGAFRSSLQLDGNYKLRARVPALGVASALVRAYTLPAFVLTYRAARSGRVRLIQRYTVPRTVDLTAPTLFYLGPRNANRVEEVADRRQPVARRSRLPLR